MWIQLKVIPFHSFSFLQADWLIADVEAEDIDLGDFAQGRLALDVDGDNVDDDPEALDSEDEKRLDEVLGIDVDEMDCKPLQIVIASR